MNHDSSQPGPATPEDVEFVDPIGYDFGLSRRGFVQWLGAGLLLTVGAAPALAQRRGGRGFGGERVRSVSARVHLARDGAITVMTGKVEGGQGARTELSEAAAEEMRVTVGRIRLILADTGLVPNDGITAGSGTTPRTVPAVRQGAAAARRLLAEFACRTWKVESAGVEIRDGKAVHVPTGRTLGYADLAGSEEGAKAFEHAIPADVVLTPVKEWKVMGVPTARPNARDLVTGAHQYPSDIARPGMLYGKILRPPSLGARLTDIDLGPAKAMKDVVVVRDDQFVGVAAPTAYLAQQALAAIAPTAEWEESAHPSSKNLFTYLREKAGGNVPANAFQDELAQAKQVLRRSYDVAYIQHAPLEPRAAVAEWAEGKLTVWTGSQNPFGCRGELARAFHIPEDHVRVIVPDFGAGFGGKHTGEAGVEAARLAQAAGRPVWLRWTRAEEFTWAYFRPAAVIDIEAGLNASGHLTSWYCVNINSGGSALQTPYQAGRSAGHFVGSNAPLRHGSYRALAATANNFARESFMDELAAAAGADPLEFRLGHLEDPRLRAVLETAARRFGWKELARQKRPNIGVGLACGTEKGSYVAACAEIEINRVEKTYRVRRACEVFECGAIINPLNLHSQVQGALLMGLGAALREEVRFENGKILTDSFALYQVGRFEDLPELDIHLLDRPDLDSDGAGETPIIAIAPAIANAVCHATGLRIRSMPIRLPENAI